MLPALLFTTAGILIGLIAASVLVVRFFFRDKRLVMLTQNLSDEQISAIKEIVKQ